MSDNSEKCPAFVPPTVEKSKIEQREEANPHI